MQLFELKNKIVTKSLDKLFIFTGPEVAIMDIYIKKIAEVSGLPLRRVDTVSNIYSKLSAKSFVSTAACYCIRDDKEFLQADKVWDTLESVIGSNIVILVYSSIDKRGKFYKHYSQNIVEFEKLTTEQLAKYINKELPGMSEKDRLLLAQICDNDYSRILLECDKIRQYAQALNKDAEVINVDYGLYMSQLLRQGVIFQPARDVVFDMVDAVLRNQPRRAWALMQELIEIGEPPVKIISLLYSNFRGVLLVQSAGNSPNISDRTGLTPWQCKLAKEKAGHFSINKLIDCLRVIRQAEEGIKTGKIEADQAVDYALVHILG